MVASTDKPSDSRAKSNPPHDATLRDVFTGYRKQAAEWKGLQRECAQFERATYADYSTYSAMKLAYVRFCSHFSRTPVAAVKHTLVQSSTATSTVQHTWIFKYHKADT